MILKNKKLTKSQNNKIDRLEYVNCKNNKQFPTKKLLKYWKFYNNKINWREYVANSIREFANQHREYRNLGSFTDPRICETANTEYREYRGFPVLTFFGHTPFWKLANFANIGNELLIQWKNFKWAILVGFFIYDSLF